MPWIRALDQQLTGTLLRRRQSSVEQNPLFSCEQPRLFLQRTPPPVATNPIFCLYTPNFYYFRSHFLQQPPWLFPVFLQVFPHMMLISGSYLLGLCLFFWHRYILIPLSFWILFRVFVLLSFVISCPLCFQNLKIPGTGWTRLEIFNSQRGREEVFSSSRSLFLASCLQTFPLILLFPFCRRSLPIVRSLFVYLSSAHQFFFGFFQLFLFCAFPIPLDSFSVPLRLFPYPLDTFSISFRCFLNCASTPFQFHYDAFPISL